MKKSNYKSFADTYKNYLAIGATILLAAWFVALLTVTFLPGPYSFDLFGVVAEKNGDNSSVNINSLAIIVGLILIPVVLTAIEILARRTK